MSDEAAPRRLIQITDVDEEGQRWPVLVTGDPHVVAATERAVRERVSEALRCPPVHGPKGAEA